VKGQFRFHKQRPLNGEKAKTTATKSWEIRLPIITHWTVEFYSYFLSAFWSTDRKEKTFLRFIGMKKQKECMSSKSEAFE